jgi:hypothetical protein
MMPQYASFCLVLSMALSTWMYAQSPSYWHETSLPAHESLTLTGQVSRGYSLDLKEIQSILSDKRSAEITLPLPSGEWQVFRLEESPVMETPLQEKFPGLKTYLIQGGDFRGRMDIQPEGVNAMFYGRGQTYFLDLLQGTGGLHAVYQKSDLSETPESRFRCHLNESSWIAPATDPAKEGVRTMGMQQNLVSLRTYRLALACTGEYAQFFGGQVATVMGTFVTAVNRLNVVFERELAIRLVLVANNDQLVFLDPNTDPYNNNNLSQMLGQNQTAVNNIIGVDNYDIGHVFSTNSGGGIAGLGVVCAGSKARGVTGRSNPVGDPFIIDYVAHEMGHQFGANHTFNNCDGNENPGTAFEPGSGSTIMAYAGLCGNNNIQFNSDDYFHAVSLDEILQYTRNGFGSTCVLAVPDDNTEPEVTLPYPATLHIPKETPFELMAEGIDAETPDALTYCWEQVDSGPRVNLGSPQGSSPSFRSLPPTAESVRSFPRMNNILNNTNNPREVLPTYGRNLNFRCTVRDNHPGAGGLAWKQIRLTSVESAGPFRVLQPGGGVVWTAGTFARVEWDPANTMQAPVSCQQVHVLLSVDGGLTWRDTLARFQPNTGSCDVWVPANPANNARVRVQAADNVFFQVNPGPISIRLPDEPGFSAKPDYPSGITCVPGQLVIPINTYQFGAFEDSLQLSLLLPDTLSGIAYRFDPETVFPGEPSSLYLEITSGQPLSTLPAALNVEADGAPFTYPFQLVLRSRIEAVPVPVSPADNSSGVSPGTPFQWEPVEFAETYRIVLDTTPLFNQPVWTLDGIQGLSVSAPAPLDINTLYYWKLEAFNQCGTLLQDVPYGFQTLNVQCVDHEKMEDLFISGSGTPTINSLINVLDNLDLLTVEVVNISGNHQSFSDLNLTLVAPDMTEVNLLNRRCGPVSTAFQFGFSDFSQQAFSCPPNAGRVHTPLQPLGSLAGRATQGDWTLRIRDVQAGSGGRFNGWTLRLCNGVSTPSPELVQDTLYLLPGTSRHLTSVQLTMTAPGVSASSLQYRIIETPEKGQLWLGGSLLRAGDWFSQEDIDNRRLYYLHLGEEEDTDSFLYVGRIADGGWTGKRSFPIRMDPDFTSSSQEGKELNSYLKVYPNPGSGQIWLEWEGSSSEALCLFFDAMGNPVYRYTLAPGQIRGELPASALRPGLYIIQVIQAGKTVQIGKLVRW